MSEIYKQMAKVMFEVDAIGKDKTNQQQGFKYRGIDQVYNALNPILAKNAIFTLPKVLNNERDERINKNGTTLFYARITMEYTFYTVDGSSVSCSVIGEGMDSGDKATNKAMAIAHKYALLQTFCIPTEDMPDPDSEVHEIVPPKQKPTLDAYLTKKSIKDKKGFMLTYEIKSAEQAQELLKDIGSLDAMVEEFKAKQMP